MQIEVRVMGSSVRIHIFTITTFISLLFLGACSDGSDSRRVDQPPLAPASDCLWAGQSAEIDESLNFGFLDTSAGYWVAVYQLPEEGSYITLENNFPHTRYMTFTTYRVAGGIIDQLTDRAIIPDNGSTNPFVEGNPRNDPSRRYLIGVESGSPPEVSRSSTHSAIYDGTEKAGDIIVLVYRTYVPDTGNDITGGVGLPRVSLHKADGSIMQGEEACEILSLGYEPAPNYFPEDMYAEMRGSSDPSHAPPLMRTNYTRQFQWRCDFGGDCSNNPPQHSGGGFKNQDTATLYSFLNRQYGEVLVLRGKIPETPETVDGDDGIFMEEELRYWSICQYGYYSQKVEGCLFDEQVQINADGYFTIVTSRPKDRPNNASDECGVGFIPWPEDGDGFGIVEGRESNGDDAYLVVRNMLPDPEFDEAIHNTIVAGDEAEVLGDYLPKGQYFTQAGFEGLGCDPWLALPYEEM